MDNPEPSIREYLGSRGRRFARELLWAAIVVVGILVACVLLAIVVTR